MLKPSGKCTDLSLIDKYSIAFTSCKIYLRAFTMVSCIIKKTFSFSALAVISADETAGKNCIFNFTGSKKNGLLIGIALAVPVMIHGIISFFASTASLNAPS